MTKLTAKMIEGLTLAFLQRRYDQPAPVPSFHKEMWAMCCAFDRCAFAAPRASAKSTSITFAFTLASILFRVRRHVLILSSNEELAAHFVAEIKLELQENLELAESFGFNGFVKETETEIVGSLGKDRDYFRIIAKGAGQRMRGLKWMRKRPDLVVADDLEDDEIVQNADRRNKFKRWLYGAVMRIGRAERGTQFIIAGTIMHMDSALENLMPDTKNPKHVIEREDALSLRGQVGEWHSVKYRAHPSMNDFSHLLWPERMTEKYLRAEQEDYRRQGLLDVYGQEMLNDPIDESVAFFRVEDIRRPPEDERRPKRFFIGWDTALSTQTKSDWTVAIAASLDHDGWLEIEDVRRERVDSLGVIDLIFEMENAWHPEFHVMEKGQIEKAILPMVEVEMRKRNSYPNIEQRNSGQEIVLRCQAIRARIRSRTVCANRDASWWPELEDELRRFPRGRHDDQCQALGLLGRMLAEMGETESREEVEERDWFGRMRASELDYGRSAVTGY